MKLENMKPAKGATHNSKRVGRGQGSGKGGTATRGTKGAQARAGYEHKIGFEGGQMPIQRRLPKFGFKNPTRVEYKGINVATLQALFESKGLKEFDVETFIETVSSPPPSRSRPTPSPSPLLQRSRPPVARRPLSNKSKRNGKVC